MGQLFQLFVCKEDTRGRGQGSGFCRERERKTKRDEKARRGESRSQRGSATQTKRCLFVSKRSWRARRCRLRTPSHPHTHTEDRHTASQRSPLHQHAHTHTDSAADKPVSALHWGWVEKRGGWRCTQEMCVCQGYINSSLKGI